MCNSSKSQRDPILQTSDPNMTAQNLLFTYGQGYFVDE